ncbi:substrate-binding periplasmic protein [Iodobacter ciconiae]|uniref:Transporter substrate-binding domain-containing protein n=1 Tax=Iodobacter ciconiae TaxID=2496266 RepID=A0A3S8ZNV0_9NEIS|nr:transporter substrate-binding domain-containing protein [Iodobacter ciconiae]AZN35120.1 transporter substrate-binding domain-containing protein [Iodobacter ciconiae]
MSKQITAIHILAAVLLTAMTSTAHSAGGCSRPVVVAASPLGFFMDIDEQNKVSGIIPDFLAEISKATACQFVYDVMPRVRALRMLESGEIDLIAASKTPKRDAVADYVNVLSEQVSLISLKDWQGSNNVLDDLMQGKMQVNVVRGFDSGPKYLELIASLRKKNRVEDVLNTDVIAQKMFNKRCDATIMGVSGFIKSAEKYNLESRLRITSIDSFPPVGAGFYFPKNSLPEKDRMLLINEITLKVKAGRVKELYKKKVIKWEGAENSLLF